MAKMKKGFTLIEVMVTTGIMALFSITLISVFLATVRSNNKAQLIQSIHLEGDFALKKMVSVIRSGQSVVCNSDEITVTTIEGTEIIFSLNTEEMRISSSESGFITGDKAEATNLSFICYQGDLDNQVVTLGFTLTVDPSDEAQVQEKFSQDFVTSVATRQ